MKALIGDREAIVDVIRYEKHKVGFSISYLDSMGVETGMMYSVSHNIKIIDEKINIKDYFFNEKTKYSYNPCQNWKGSIIR